MIPGIYYSITNEHYHGGDGVNKGLLDVVRRSPRHAKAVMDRANDNEPTAAQMIGSAFHTLVLESHKFDDEYAVAPKCDRRTKAGKEAWAEFIEANPGKTLLDEEQHEQLQAMAQAVHQHPAAHALLTGCGGEAVAEASVYWTDAITGELCRCRPDFWRADGVIVDVKTTEDASQEGFAQSLAKWRYHVQAPWYLDGLQAAFDAGHFPEGWAAPQAFVFLVVEKKAPYAVATYILDAESAEIGRKKYRADLDRLAECKRTNVWPGYGDSLQMIGVPQWYLMRNAHLVGAA